MNFKPISCSYTKKNLLKSTEKIPSKGPRYSEDNKENDHNIVIKHNSNSNKDIVQIPLNNNTVVSITRTSEKKPQFPNRN